MSVPIDQYQRYVPLDAAELRTKCVELRMMIEQGLKTFGANTDTVEVCEADLLEAIERVEKRRVYFWTYYGLQMSEKNETALYVFWLLKFAPLMDAANPDRDLNVLVALHLLVRMLTYVANNPAHIGRKLVLTGAYLKQLAYALRFRDLSKEAIMAIMESLLV